MSSIADVPTRGRPRPPAELRRARAAVGALFFTNGALFANLLPRFPEIKADLDIGSAAYGAALAAFPAGSIVAGLGSGPLIRRFGSAGVAVAGTISVGTLTLVAAVAPSLGLFVAALAIAGAADAVTDVGQNAHGLRVQRRYGRSIINSFHATWSIGAVAGGSMAAGAIALGLSRGLHLAIAAALFAVVALVALRFCLPGRDDDVHGAESVHRAASPSVAAARRRRTGLVLAALVLIAVAGAVVEDAGSSWAAVYLSDSLHTSAALAAAGYVALVAAQFAGRATGDRFVDRYGQRAVARAGGVLTAAGMGFALAVPTVATTVAGFAAAGLGVATLVPVAMHEADGLPGLRPGTGLTLVSWLMRVGFLLSPPLVGIVADSTSLRVGLLVVPAAGVSVVLLAGVLQTRPARPGPTRTSASGAGRG